MSIQKGLLRIEQEKIIIDAITELIIESENNWVNLAQVGAVIRQNGLKYGKLFPFLKSFANVLEFQENHDLEKPVAYIRLKK
jgi:hypothetical protein